MFTFHYFHSYYQQKQDADGTIEKEVDQQPETPQKTPETPPNIPPLPQSHLQTQRAKTPEKGSSVAKIISQFQEAANISNVINCDFYCGRF